MAGVIQRARDEAMQQGVQQGIQQGVQQGIQQGVQQGIQQGVQQGRQQGMRQGRVEGERMVLERQLRRRFGALAPEVADRLNRATAADLETWADNVLDAETLDEVFD